ncbi:hypothetical protein [Rhodoblastus sp.]|uniref:hypothetical protein n=1 Tax=Rhodoblastus sp. TaxID=1962975 RepID=UPI002609934B|nr:hypothetical protein [Rhodoblastus sp.]
MSRLETRNAAVRRRFLIFFSRESRIISPIMVSLALAQIALGVFAGLIEHWSLGHSIWFTFAPHRFD